MALLPFLQSFGRKFKSGLEEVREQTQDFFKPTTKVRGRDVVRELGTIGKTIGQETARFTGGAALGIGRAVVPSGRRQIPSVIDTSTGTLGRTIFGGKPVGLTIPGLSTETLTQFGVGRQRAQQISSTRAALPIVFAGAFVNLPGFKLGGTVSKKLTASVFRKYGEPLGSEIIKGGKELVQFSLVSGGEDKVAHALKLKPVQVTIGKIIGAIKEAKAPTAITKRLASEERKRRVAIASKVLAKGEGEEAFREATSKLGGKLPQAVFTPIKSRFTDDELKGVFDFIKTHPDLQFFQKINAADGLNNVIGKGKQPRPFELKLLKQIFGDDFAQAVLKKRPFGEKALEQIADVANVPRALMSSADMSAPFRQGLIMSIHKPKIAARAFIKQFGFFFDPKKLKASYDEISVRNSFQLMKDSKLQITDIGETALTLTEKEEAFMTNLAERIPGVGRIVKASERSYVGYLNQLRADSFDDIANQFIKSGISPDESPEVFKRLASFVNAATGRGDLPEVLNKSAPILNSVFFSPRLQAARLQLLNPVWYAKQPKPVRREAAKAFLKFMGVGIGILSLAKLGGAEVEENPTSSDFGKIRIGNFRWDVWAGYQQWVRLGATMILGEKKSATTGKIRKLAPGQPFGGTRLEELTRFGRGKFAPVPSLITDIIEGQSLIGEPIGPKTFYSRMIPFIIQDITEAAKEAGLPGAIGIGVPAFFGVSTNVFDAPKKGKFPTLPELPSF